MGPRTVAAVVVLKGADIAFVLEGHAHGVQPFDCVTDSKAAVRALRERAAEFGIDPHKVAAGGGSAGGHVAACTGTVPGFEPKDAKVSSRPQVMVLFNPV